MSSSDDGTYLVPPWGSHELLFVKHLAKEHTVLTIVFIVSFCLISICIVLSSDSLSLMLILKYLLNFFLGFGTYSKYTLKSCVILLYDPAIPLLGIYPEKTIIQKDTCTTVFITVLFAIARLQQYVNRELPGVQAGCRKGRRTRDQIANIRWIMEKGREFWKKHIFLLYWLCQSLWLCGSQ